MSYVAHVYKVQSEGRCGECVCVCHKGQGERQSGADCVLTFIRDKVRGGVHVCGKQATAIVLQYSLYMYLKCGLLTKIKSAFLSLTFLQLKMLEF